MRLGRIFSQPTRSIVMVSAIMAGTLGIFQNCSNVSFQNASSNSKSDITTPNPKPSGRFVINGGSSYTNDVRVKLQIQDVANASEISTSNEPGCDPDQMVFQPLAMEVDWDLLALDGTRTVYVQLRSDKGESSACLEQSIDLDRVAPKASVERGPDPYVAVTTARFEVSGTDEVSGVDHFLCRVGVNELKKCEVESEVEVAAEGNHTFHVVAVDRAGNKSDVTEYNWFVDQTAPQADVVAPYPPARGAVNAAMVYFEARDPDGSGIERTVCWLNGASLGDCESPKALMNLADGNYVFEVAAYDKANNLSQKASRTFAIDTAASGDFMVLGVIGGSDVKVDNYLADRVPPRVQWMPSQGAEGYIASILNQNQQRVCGPVNVGAAATAAQFETGCALSDGVTYYADIRAYRNSVIEKRAPLFAFRPDTTGPIISISKIDISDDQKLVKIDFRVEDGVAGLDRVTCVRTLNGNAATQDCLDKSTVEYTNLAIGTHAFRIEAQDRVGNASALTRTFEIRPIVCDPLNGVALDKCVPGLKGNLYYASAEDRLKGNDFLRTKFDVVDKLLTEGLRSNALIYLSAVHVPTRRFEEGFGTSEKDFVKDDAGTKLIEWFALDLETFVKLGPTDAPGEYQFIVLSDDGSLVSIKDSPQGPYRPFINNDGLTSTRVGCALNNEAVAFTANRRLPMRIKYYQGPRTEISLSLYWRPKPANGAQSQYCGSSTGGGSAGFGTPENYKLLADEGWRPLTKDNFITQDTIK